MATSPNPTQIDLAHTYDQRPVLAEIVQAQIGTDYQKLAGSLAGEFQPAISRIFPDQFLALYLLTDVRRRQVWHGFLAGMALHDPSFVEQTDPSELRRTLLDQSSG